MNILFIHEIDWLRKVVYEIHSLPELLSSFGHNVFVIDLGELYERSHAIDLGTLRTTESKVGRAHSDSPITLIRPGFIKLPFLDRASAFFTHYFEIERILKNKNIDVVVLYSVPTDGLQTIKLAREHGIPVVFRSLDTLHMLVTQKMLRPFTFALEKRVYRRVDRVLTESPKLSEYVIRMGADSNRVELLSLGVDMDKFNPEVDTRDIEVKLGIGENDGVIVFIGTLFDFSGLDSYLEQFPQVLREIPNARLVIVGDGPLMDRLKNLVTELGLEKNVVLTGFQPFDTMPQYINLADVCINPFVINDTTRDIIPGKMSQYLACGKPVLSTPLPGMTTMIQGPNQGVVYADISEFAENTIRLLKDANMARAIGENGYLYARDEHDEKRIARRLETILHQMTNCQGNVSHDDGHGEKNAGDSREVIDNV
jgi:glycosyltransferase involved in cell wall biosynthesis